ncbi:venom factor [Caerostris darwini]|uniref:Venom factor n=1 Tax=Caerostris darwini TaxID=1538125 RepID=A0AAV4UQI1_9ARAC|nr:venom factor [Caerostris darwini]
MEHIFEETSFSSSRQAIMMKVVGIIALCLFSVAFADDDVKVPSACQEDRARRLNATLTESILHLIPECEENGDYAALQCFTANDWCVCYRRNGENINTPSKNIKACECIRQKDDALVAEDTYVPDCDKNGYFKEVQCERDECWCVDKKGKVLSDPQVGRDIKC